MHLPTFWCDGESFFCIVKFGGELGELNRGIIRQRSNKPLDRSVCRRILASAYVSWFVWVNVTCTTPAIPSSSNNVHRSIWPVLLCKSCCDLITRSVIDLFPLKKSKYTCPTRLSLSVGGRVEICVMCMVIVWSRWHQVVDCSDERERSGMQGTLCVWTMAELRAAS
jgi:hypothetical protein